MSQDLNCRIGAVAIGRHTELGADIICSHSCIVSSKNNVGEVSALLGHIQNKICDLEVGLRHSEVEYSLSSRQVNWYSGVDASLCRAEVASTASAVIVERYIERFKK